MTGPTPKGSTLSAACIGLLCRPSSCPGTAPSLPQRTDTTTKTKDDYVGLSRRNRQMPGQTDNTWSPPGSPLTAAGKGLANFSTYSARAASTSWCPLKMISTAPCQRGVKLSPERDPNPDRASNALSFCVIVNFTANQSKGTGHAQTECRPVAPVPSLSFRAPDCPLKPGCSACFPLSAAFLPSLPQALGTQYTPQEACVEGLAFRWGHSLVISGTLAQP